MKNIIVIFLIFIIMIFLLPAIFTQPFKMANQEELNINSEDNNNKTEAIEEPPKDVNEQYNYNEYSNIKVLHTKNGEIEELPLDTYLLGVVSAEMPADFEQEALKAQAVVARTYTMYSIKHNQNKHEGADICDNPNCCQAWISKDDRFARWDENLREQYWNKITTAVESTKGIIITYDGEPIDAFFHSNSGGTTETPVNVWGGTNFPYLQSVQTSGEDAYSQYSSEVILSKDELINKIKQNHTNFEINFDNPDCIKILEHTDSNRVKLIKIGNLNLSGVEVRTLIRTQII